MPCGTAGICGISSCFQLLSPGMRQVIHALLTRPPLSLRTLPTEIVRVRRSVRLACVKHAASVHPEPGSNSLAKFISPGFRLFLSILLYCLGCFCSFLFLFSNQRIFRNSFIVTFVTCMIVCFAVQLSKYCFYFSAVRCSPRQLCYIITFCRSLSTTFFIFFNLLHFYDPFGNLPYYIADISNGEGGI